MAGIQRKVAIGIDLGGTAVKIGILNRAYDLLAWTSIPTRAARPCAEVVADIGQAAKALLRDNGYTCADCIGVGIGSPGTVDSQSGIVLYSNNIRWEQVPLAATLNKYIPVPVFASNDANCAALGEVLKGAAAGCKNAVFLTLGTGVGGGIVIDGKLFEGGHAGGVEPGHIRIGSEGRRCTCGRMDCLEAYASATALIRDAKEMAAQHPASLLWELCGRQLEQMDAKMPFDAAQAGDACGKKLTARYIGYLADGITDLVNIFRPDIVVLGGGVCAQGETLTEPINRYLRENCFGGPVAHIPRVVVAKNGNHAGMIGAAGLLDGHGVWDA
ncbi:MAG: ROK family protein [Eubacterium sp.]|nr:ROK family protein [Eubacterium sp.]